MKFQISLICDPVLAPFWKIFGIIFRTFSASIFGCFLGALFSCVSLPRRARFTERLPGASAEGPGTILDVKMIIRRVQDDGKWS